MIRKAVPNNYPKLVFLYQKAFLTHNIFSKSEKEILEYIGEADKKNVEHGGGFFVYVFEEKIVGSVLLKLRGESNNHRLWSINHLAVDNSYRNKGIATKLVNHVEKIVSKSSATAKIEIHVSENEHDAIQFYEKLGYRKEGVLKSHYRFNEEVTVMGKEISKG